MTAKTYMMRCYMTSVTQKLTCLRLKFFLWFMKNCLCSDFDLQWPRSLQVSCLFPNGQMSSTVSSLLFRQCKHISESLKPSRDTIHSPPHPKKKKLLACPTWIFKKWGLHEFRRLENIEFYERPLREWRQGVSFLTSVFFPCWCGYILFVTIVSLSYWKLYFLTFYHCTL